MTDHVKYASLLLFLLFLLFVFPSHGQVNSSGSLVIGGGGLRDDNAPVFEQYVALAGGKELASIAVIPSASGAAGRAFNAIRTTLIQYGVNPDAIHLIPLAMVDDDNTPDVDESTWKENANDPELAALVLQCSGIWFSGGDQNRTTAVLYNDDGSHTKVLEAVWKVYGGGGVIGGTSAGAAIMSDPMIGGGNSLGALAHGVKNALVDGDFPESEGVLLTRGLGFFPAGTIDQHFGARSRIGRLAVAMLFGEDKTDLGFGIDENTALIYEANTGICRVAGGAGVVILDASRSTSERTEEGIAIENLRIHRLENGDSYHPGTGGVVPAPGKTSTAGKEYYNNAVPGQGGILSGYAASLEDLLIANLMDNAASSTVSNLSLRDSQNGFMVTFTKDEESQAYFTDQPDGYDHYTVVSVKMDIMPVTVSLHTKSQ